MSEEIEPLKPKKLKKRDPFPAIHWYIFQVGFTVFALFEFAKFLRYLWNLW